MKYPAETECPVCKSIFVQPRRKQGGGRRTIYCSPRCRSLDWVRGNGAKRTATILKYDNKPENKEKKSARQRRYTLQRYGMTEAGFQEQLQKQEHCCAGCGSTLTEATAMVGHNHITKATRGLLCNHCNWAVGHARDNPNTLRTLATYLESYT